MILSLIIPVYNGEEYIERCLNSITSQSLLRDQYEIIIIDDGSTDKTSEIIKLYSKKLTNIKVIRQSNKGQSAARNKGIKEAKGKYIWFIDADDFILPDTINYLINIVNNDYQDEIIDIIIFDFLSGDIDKYPAEIILQNDHSISIHTGLEYCSKKYFPNYIWYYLIRREFINKLDLYFEEGVLLEDGPFTSFLFLNANKIIELKTKIYYYVNNADSTMHTRDIGRMQKLIEGYKYAADAMDKQLYIKGIKLTDEAKYLIKVRRDSYLFFMFIRLLRFHTLRDIKEAIKWCKELNLYPISEFPNKYYISKKYKYLIKIINHPPLLVFTSYMNNLKRTYIKR